MIAVTPLLITWNEESNLERCLAALAWADEIVVVDSGSDDATLDVLGADPRVRVFQRPFDSFARQCSFGIERISPRRWVLSLDADHVLSEPLIAELQRLDPAPRVAGYAARFAYCVHGRPLRGSMYPPRIVLFRRQAGRFEDDGHGHRVEVRGEVERLTGLILHDDRKSLSRWLDSQLRYARKEALKINRGGVLSWPDRLRRNRIVAPFGALFYCLVVKRGLLDGWAGWHYALQRLLAETVLAMRLVDEKLEERSCESGQASLRHRRGDIVRGSDELKEVRG